jgi:hypothetical protein
VAHVQLRQHALHGGNLGAGHGVAHVHHVQQQRRLADLLQGGTEGRNLHTHKADSRSEPCSSLAPEKDNLGRHARSCRSKPPQRSDSFLKAGWDLFYKSLHVARWLHFKDRGLSNPTWTPAIDRKQCEESCSSCSSATVIPRASVRFPGPHQLGGQLLDEAHGVGEERLFAVGQVDPPGGGVQRGKQLVLRQHVRATQPVQQSALARIGVPHLPHHSARISCDKSLQRSEDSEDWGQIEAMCLSPQGLRSDPAARTFPV